MPSHIHTRFEGLPEDLRHALVQARHANWPAR